MLHSKVFRLTLLIIIIVSSVLILRSLSTRVGSRPAETEQETILPEEVLRKTTDFEHSQLRNGKVLFRVIAGSSTMKEGGDNILERVSLWRFDEAGEPSDMIEGEEAVYNPNKKEILFTGDVVIRLERGVLIYADQAHGDLKTETMVIKEQYRMEHDSVLGRGSGLEYKFVSQRLRFLNGMEMVMDEVSDRKEIRALKGLYLMNEGRINLAGGAVIEGQESDINGDSMDISLDENGQLTRLLSLGDASFTAGSNAFFSGDRILLNMVNNLLTVEGSQGQDAVFLGGDSDQAKKIFADVIFCSFLPENGEKWVLKGITADGNVRIDFPGQQIEECRGEHFSGQLLSGTNSQFESITLDGDVFLAHAASRESRETLSCQVLDIEMDSRGLPGLIRAKNGVTAEIFGQVKGDIPEKQELKAEDFLRIEYKDGIIERINAFKDCMLTSSSSEQENKLESESIQVDFFGGSPVRAFAKGDVRGRNKTGSGVRNMSSGQFEVFYEDGFFAAFEQSGAVIQKESADGRSFEIHSDFSRYENKSRLLEARGGNPFMIITETGEDGTQKMETRAREISLSRENNLLKAVGSVKSIFYLQENSMVFLAAEMESDMGGGMIEYRGDARLLLDENIIMGDKMFLNSDSRNLSVEGGVDSKFVGADGEENGEFRITSVKLDLDTEGGTASYRDDVVFDSSDLGIEAPFLVVHTGSGDIDKISRIEAWGGVTIREEGRIWNGERAVYVKETGKVLVDGK